MAPPPPPPGAPVSANADPAIVVVTVLVCLGTAGLHAARQLAFGVEPAGAVGYGAASLLLPVLVAGVFVGVTKSKGFNNASLVAAMVAAVLSLLFIGTTP